MSSSLLIVLNALDSLRKTADDDDDNSDDTTAEIMAFSQTCSDARRMLENNPNRFPVYFFKQRSALVMDAMFTRKRNVLLQGPAGAGKTTVTNRVYRHARDTLNLVVYMLAPTQAAAELLEGGQTIHSFLHLRKTETIESLEYKWLRFEDKGSFASIFKPREAFPELIILDEISMIGDSMLEAVDYVLRRRPGGDIDQVMGGVQIMCVGDFCQLPPVAAKKAFTWSKWSQMAFYKVYLEHPLRQEGDLAWFNYLQRVRCGAVPCYTPLDGGPDTLSNEDFERMMAETDPMDRPMILSAENKKVEEMNMQEFNRLQSPVERRVRAQDYLVRRFPMGQGRYRWTQVIDEQPTAEDLEKVSKSWRLQTEILLKVGARYVITFNLCKREGIYNGQNCVYVGNNMFKYKRRDGSELVCAIDRLMATHIVPTGRESNLYVSRQQVALRLGYATTVHKSQGMTMSRVAFDIGKLRCPGQYYVACSRVKSRRDIVVINAPENKRLQISGEVLAYVFGPREDDEDECI